MAKIRVVERGGQYRVSIRGSLQASDLRRLERACARALELEVLPLVIRLDTTVSDAAARAYLGRLRTRGAAIRPRGRAERRVHSDSSSGDQASRGCAIRERRGR